MAKGELMKLLLALVLSFPALAGETVTFGQASCAAACGPIATSDPAVMLDWVAFYQPQPYPKPNIEVDDFTASNVTLLSSTGFVTVTDRVTQTTAKVCQGWGGMGTA